MYLHFRLHFSLILDHLPLYNYKLICEMIVPLKRFLANNVLFLLFLPQYSNSYTFSQCGRYF